MGCGVMTGHDIEVNVNENDSYYILMMEKVQGCNTIGGLAHRGERTTLCRRCIMR